MEFALVARLPVENGYLFVHIPKTAGTSFRDSLQEVFGDGLYCDYGVDEPTTSPVILDYIHKRNAYPEFGDFLAQQKKAICLSGHYPIKKYAPLFPIHQVMLFMRDPIQRVISQYEHVCRVEKITESLESFCSKPAHMNLQSRNIGRTPYHLIGFIGLQEFYSESLQMLRSQMGLHIKEAFLNMNDQRASVKYQPDSELLKLLEKNNEQDLALYKKINTLFKQRYELFTLGKHYIHGAVTAINNNRITGWAVNQSADEPVELTLLVNGKVVGQTLANSYRHTLREWNVNRQAYIGFDFTVKNLSEHDQLECVVSESGQVLPLIS